MTAYLCVDPECPELDVPKEAGQVYDEPVRCGRCGNPTQLDETPTVEPYEETDDER